MLVWGPGGPDEDIRTQEQRKDGSCPPNRDHDDVGSVVLCGTARSGSLGIREGWVLFVPSVLRGHDQSKRMSV
jgi:hypothetical protein